MQPKNIDTLDDIANLSPDEFTRFLPDFIAWYKIVRKKKDIFGNDVVIGEGMEWYDDNEPGFIRGVTIRSLGEKP